MRLNPQVLSLSKSTTLKITALNKKLISEGKDVVNLAAGEPDFDTPIFAKEAAKLALEEGFTKYTPSAGMPALKAAIAAKFQQENHIPYQQDNIIVTAGAKYALYASLLALLSPGDEVIIPSPYWVSYPEMVKLCGAKSVFLTTEPDSGFKIRPQSLEEAITAKTKVFILNYPANPTAVTYSEDELNSFAYCLRDKNVFVLSDEIYEALLYDGIKHVSFASLKGMYEKTITVNGFSKAFSMTGWRLGYLGGPADLVEQISKIIDHTTSCACSIAQRAGMEALEHHDFYCQIREKFQERRDLLWKGLRACEYIRPYKSQGTFYMFCDIRDTGLNSFDFANRLLKEHLVSCVPADAFGLDGFIRFSFATSNDQIIKGIERINAFVKSLK